MHRYLAFTGQDPTLDGAGAPAAPDGPGTGDDAAGDPPPHGAAPGADPGGDGGGPSAGGPGAAGGSDGGPPAGALPGAAAAPDGAVGPAPAAPAAKVAPAVPRLTNVFDTWGPITFSYLKAGGVVATWPRDVFIINPSNRDAVSITDSVSYRMAHEERVLRIKRWLLVSFHTWMGDDASSTKLLAHFKKIARSFDTPLPANIVDEAENSGVWPKGSIRDSGV